MSRAAAISSRRSASSNFSITGMTFRPEPLGGEHQLQHAIVLHAVADQQDLVIGDVGQGGHQLGLGTALQSHAKRSARVEDLLDHLVELVDLDRVDATVAALVTRFIDGVGERQFTRSTRARSTSWKRSSTGNSTRRGGADPRTTVWMSMLSPSRREVRTAACPASLTWKKRSAQSSTRYRAAASSTVQGVCLALIRLSPVLASRALRPSTWAKMSGATMVASDSMMKLGVVTSSLPHVIFSLGRRP